MTSINKITRKILIGTFTVTNKQNGNPNADVNDNGDDEKITIFKRKTQRKNL